MDSKWICLVVLHHQYPQACRLSWQHCPPMSPLPNVSCFGCHGQKHQEENASGAKHWFGLQNKTCRCKDVHTHTLAQTGGWTDRQRQTDRQTDRQTYRQRQTDRQTDTDRQTETMAMQSSVYRTVVLVAPGEK